MAQRVGFKNGGRSSGSMVFQLGKRDAVSEWKFQHESTNKTSLNSLAFNKFGSFCHQQMDQQGLAKDLVKKHSIFLLYLLPLFVIRPQFSLVRISMRTKGANKTNTPVHELEPAHIWGVRTQTGNVMLVQPSPIIDMQTKLSKDVKGQCSTGTLSRSALCEFQTTKFTLYNNLVGLRTTCNTSKMIKNVNISHRTTT